MAVNIAKNCDFEPPTKFPDASWISYTSTLQGDDDLASKAIEGWFEQKSNVNMSTVKSCCGACEANAFLTLIQEDQIAVGCVAKWIYHNIFELKEYFVCVFSDSIEYYQPVYTAGVAAKGCAKRDKKYDALCA